MALSLPRMEQIAWHVPNITAAKALLGTQFGMTDWVDDEAVGLASVFGSEPQTVKALLSFNYQMGFEFELLNYPDGWCWHAHPHRTDRATTPAEWWRVPFLSHIGYHVPDAMLEAATRWPGVGLAQVMTTTSHTNRYLVTMKRHYRYVVLDTRDLLGFDVKLIQRLTTP